MAQKIDIYRARRFRAQWKTIAIYGALLLVLSAAVLSTSDGTETHGGPGGTTDVVLTTDQPA